jgi:hypothetical protein
VGGDPSDILNRMGTVKNPVLLSSGSFSGAMLWFGHQLVAEQQLIAALTGAAMVLMSVCVFLCGLGFYVYAFLRLPSSTQELMFLQEAKVAVAHHSGAKTTSQRRPQSAGRRRSPAPQADPPAADPTKPATDDNPE